MIVKDLLIRARYILSDLATSRWSDDRLLILLNEGLNDIAKTTILFVKTAYVKLNAYQTEYDLSDFAIKVIRVEYQDKELAPMSHSELDRKDSTWQQREGSELLCYVLDKQKEACIKVYPKLVGAVNSVIDFDGNYGIVTGVTYSDLQLEVEGILGDLGGVDTKDFIKLYYIERPAVVTSTLEDIAISSIVQEALTHFIAARAFRDNLDVQNRTMGAEELKLYGMQLASYALEKAKNFSQAGYSSTYNPSGV